VDSRTERVTVTGAKLHEAAAALEANPQVVHAVPNYVARATTFTPNDPGKSGPGGWSALQWNFAGPFGIDVQGAWDNAILAKNPGGAGVTVAVLDTGVAYRTSADHRYRRAPDLERARFVRGYDFVRNNDLPYDRNGHGTFVAGVVAQSTNNGIGLTGVAYRARIMPIRVLDFEGKGDVATIARGVRLAARRGARVINMSFEFDIGLTSAEIPDVLSALRFAHRKGVVMVAAAGNTEETRIAYPARAKQVIAVGATTEHGCVADYSNSGYGLDLVAPGGGADAFIDTDANCKPLEDPGRDVYQYTFRGTSPRKFGLPSGYEGTSMAVPHVSGTAALILGARTLGERPSPEAVAQRLQSTSRDLGVAGYDELYGWGLLNAAAATLPLTATPPPPAVP
jgi:serine protease